MVDLGTYEVKYLNTGKITPEESFTNDYSEEIHESEKVRTSTKLLHVILYAQCEKTYLQKVMENKCQRLTEAKHNELQKSLQNI